MASTSSSIPIMASSSSISGSNPPKYDVFLSFRGEDTRTNFRSHLDDALKRSGLVTFFDDRDLKTGDEVSSSLPNAIRSSSLSIIILSQNFASSSWCLRELVEILECYKTGKQIILPIFYHVIPSDVMNQNGTYGEAFAEHEKRFKEMQDKVPKWRAALTRLSRVAKFGWGLKPDDEQKQNGTYGEAFAKDEERFKDTRDEVQKWRDALAQVAGLSGYHLMPDDKQLETKFIEKIVKDVLAKLNRVSSGDHLHPGFVGIRSRVETVESLLCLDSLDFCMVGIWGMGGIGKTTIARAVYNRIANQFKAFCFLENVRNDAKNGPNDLQKKLLSEVLGEGNHILNNFTLRRLGGMKILIVIDDVDGSKHLKDLVGNLSCWFGPGSRIIVTSRDRQVLKNVVDEFKLYEVEGLNEVEAPQLFSLNAFKQRHSREDLMELSSKFVHYAKGNPLALKVLGCSLFEKSMEEWESSLDKLIKSPDSGILDVLRVSYDRLDYQGREVFLFIACFFKGEEIDRVTTILNGCGFSALAVISGLVDKCLVTITYGNMLSVHDLIRDMGRYVVFQESIKKPGERSRLWDPQEICDLFKKNTGTEAVESISLDLSQISELYISPDAFTRMPNLKLLKFYFSTDMRTASDSKWRKEMNKVKIIGEGLESLPDELRYLCWHEYPLKSLPLKFNIEHLVDLEMPHSKLQHLRKDTEFLGKKLRRIDLRECRELTEVPDLYQATNLESMQLGCCSTLTKFPKISSHVTLTQLCLRETAIEEVPDSAIKCLSKILSLDISHNTRLRKLPSMRHLTSLGSLYLSGCSNITEFPDVSGAITCLDLSKTGIEEVPDSAIESLSKMYHLDLSYNTRLRNLPSMRHLTSLLCIYLDGCSNITEFPDVSGEISNLSLSGTAIEEVPYSAIKSLSNIHDLDISRNTRLGNLPSMRHLTSLWCLSLSGCSNITEFPDISGKIETLHLDETGIEEVPSFVGRRTDFKLLNLENCKRLKKISSSIFQLESGYDDPKRRLDLSGCSKLEDFPEVLENEGMLNTSIEYLSMRYCKHLQRLPNSLCNLTCLRELDLSGCPGVEKMLEKVLISSPSGLCSLERLDLSECKMTELPSALSRLSSLEYLSLLGNEFESLSLELFTSLISLDISNCKRLRCLQSFPLVLVAGNCNSLKTLPDTNGVSANYKYFCYFHNCPELNESARVNIQAVAQLITPLDIHIMLPVLNQIPIFIEHLMYRFVKGSTASSCFPGSEIPEWLIYQNQGSSIEVDLPPHSNSNKFMGFVVCFVASCESSNHNDFTDVKCEFKIKDPDCDGNGQDITFNFPKIVIEHPESDHVFIRPITAMTVLSYSKSYIPMTDARFKTENSFCWEKARFRFSTTKKEEEDCQSESDSCCKVKKCGINLVYSEWEKEDCHSESEEEDCHSESEEEDCHSHDVIGKEEEEDCHSESEEEDCHSQSEKRKKKIATQNQKLIPSADRVKEEPKLDKHFFSGWTWLFIFFFPLFVMFIFHSLNIYK